MLFQVASSFEKHNQHLLLKRTEINIFNYVTAQRILNLKNIPYRFICYYLFIHFTSFQMCICFHVISGLEEGKVFWKFKLSFFICLALLFVHASHTNDYILS